MPEETYWETLFDVSLILDAMGIDASIETALEFGSGYGTFTLPVAHRIGGRLIAIDLEQELIDRARLRATQEGLHNITFEFRDFVATGTGCPVDSVDYVLLFNILHHSEPAALLAETRRILKPGARAGAVHWRTDIATPRGPDLSIRPRPEFIENLFRTAGFNLEPVRILPPYHFGLIAVKPE